MKFISQAMARIDDLSVRERGAIFIAILAVVFFIWDSYLMSFLDSREKSLKSQLQQKQSEQTALNSELQILISRSQEDPNRENRETLAELRKQLEEIAAEVTESTKHLISPDKMAVVLENVLNKTRGLELVEVRSLGASPLVPGGKKADQETGQKQVDDSARQEEEEKRAFGNAYRHGLRIVFNGGYMSTLAYVKELESLENEFIWENLKFEITEYPDGKVSITVFTLSLDRNWIASVKST